MTWGILAKLMQRFREEVWREQTGEIKSYGEVVVTMGISHVRYAMVDGDGVANGKS